MGGKYKYFKNVLTVFIIAILCLQLPGFYLKANGEEITNKDRKFEIKSIQEAGKSNNSDVSVSSLDDNVTAEQLAKKLVGDGVEIRNVTYKGANQAAGTFQAKQNIFGIEDGVILSTGNAKGIIGPNKYNSYTQINNQQGDSLLEGLLGGGTKTFDASVLEFELKPSKERMNMKYVLASDEYEEFSWYSDAIGVFVNDKNVAFVPNTYNEPITTASINQWHRSYYVSNTKSTKNTEMDGMSTVLEAKSNLNVNEWNKIKLIIADGRDSGVDSNLLVQSIKFEDAAEKESEIQIKSLSSKDISAEKVKIVATFKRTNNLSKQDSVEWKLAIPKIKNSTEQIKNQGKLIFEEGESEKDIEVEVNKEERDLQISLYSPSEKIRILGSGNYNLFLRGLSIQPTPIKLAIGEEQQFKVIAQYRDGKEIDVTEKVELELNNSDIVQLNANNKIIGKQYGAIDMKVTYGNTPGWGHISVEKALKDIEVIADSTSMTEGESTKVKVKGVYEGNEKEEVYNGVQIISSDENIIQVKDGRILEAIGPGVATITIQYAGIKKTLDINVKESNSKIVGLNLYYSNELLVGETTSYWVQAQYDNGLWKTLNPKDIQIISSNQEVLEIGKDNLYLNGKKEGQSILKITYKNYTTEMLVKVKEKEKEIVLNKDRFTIKEGAKDNIVVKAKYENREEDITNQVSFWINDGNLAELIENKEIKGLRQGQTTLVVIYKNHEIRVPIYVENGLKDLEFQESNITLPINGTKKLQVTGVYEENYRSPINNEATFSSNNDNVKVDKFGNIVAQKEGESIITVSVRDIKKEVKVKVENPLVALQVGTEKIALKTKEAYELKVTGLYEDGSLKDITKSVNFKSSNSSVVEVDASGKLVAQDKKGTATVTITKDKQSLRIPVEVTEKETGLLLEVQDGNGRGIDNVSVVLEDSQKKLNKLITDGNGTLSLKPQEGTYKVYVYKKGYKPSLVDVDVKKDERTKKKVVLEPSQLFDGKMNVTQMSKEEIEKAGIDVNHPDNRHVYKFELHLKIDNEEKKVDYIINNVGKIIQGDLDVSIGNGDAGELKVYPVVIQNERFAEKEAPPAVGYMVVPGKVSWLKEFFKVEVMIQSFADEPFELTNTNVSLNLPEGLSLAPINAKQSETIHLGTIGGNEVKKAEWYIRGDKKGEYHLGANFSSTLYPFDEQLSAEFKTVKPIEVYGEDGVKMHIKVDKKANKGFPYLVKVGIENKSPNVIYDLKVELNEAEKKNFVYTPGTEMSRVVNSIKSGETVWLDYLLLPTITGDLNIGKSFIKKVGDGANVETVLSTIE
ncbi:choice-of-anchor L domain-containing protein [Bacillus hominis]|uniref:choice-of-anchor L domain-containing protein n=1 Tax=Bacillus hominis TaxID=2817478 RepID=UPI001BB3DA58|nr:choice-of-anchor L domain-containing protein [Bacillus hominis]